MQHRTKAIFIAAVAALAVIVLLVVAIIKNGRDNITNDAQSTGLNAGVNEGINADLNAGLNSEGNAGETAGLIDAAEADATANTMQAVKDSNGEVKVIGTWYSDRSDKDTITFSDDGSYISSAWLAPGQYEVKGEVITLTDTFGTAKEFIVKTQGAAIVLFSDNKTYSHTYYMTEELAEQSLKGKQPDGGTLQEYYRETINQLLPGSWISTDETTEVVFSAQGFIVKDYEGKLKKADKNAVPKANYAFTITEITSTESHYLVTMDVTDLDHKQTFTLEHIKIFENEAGSYTLYNKSFPYADTLDKSGPVAISGSLTDPNRYKGKVTVVPNVVTEEERAAIKKGFIGTWKGSVDPARDGNVLHQTYVFKSDGTYSMSYEGHKETGTYKLKHDYEDDLFPHTLILTTGGTTAEKIFNYNESDKIIRFYDMKMPELKKQ